MWWLDPGKEVLNILFNRILAPYVMNLDMNQVNYGIGQGQLTLRSLQLKKGALDKFRLPVDVIEGHLGKFTLSLHWMNLGNQPVEVLIEDVYLLVVPSSESGYNPEEEARRIQAAKAERLENAELLHMRGQAEQPEGDQQQSQGLISSLITKIVNNLQVTVKNIHIRYEDKLSVPGHPFAAGVTLAGFTAVSVNDSWLPAFIDSTAGVIHKLAKLESLALYFDTDAPSLAGLSHTEFVEKFAALIAAGDKKPEHQFILEPVTGEGRIKMNRKQDKHTPQFDIELLFDQIGVVLDEDQYRDAISLVDMYHFYIRQHQYMRYKPQVQAFHENRARTLWKFALDAIQDEVRQRKRQWTWAYFAERRDDRHRYIDLFKRKQMGPLPAMDVQAFDDLEKKLSYEDLRFYRSVARSQLRKDIAYRKKQEEERKQSQQASKSTGWSSWLWGSGSSTQSAPADVGFTGEMTDEQRQQLYEVLDFDEKAALTAAFQTPRDALKLRANAKLDRGSFALRTDPHGKNKEITSISFDGLQAAFLQRTDNFETSLSLRGFAVRDGTTTNSIYPYIVHVQDERNNTSSDDPFFYLMFEKNPLDERADTALTFRMRYMEIVYHRGYIEAVYRFFKPPASQLESVEALLSAASETLDGFRKETRAGLEYALQTHKTIDIQMDLNAPIIIIPESITTNVCNHLVIDAGHISVESELANKKAVRDIYAKRKQQYTEEDYKRLESMMYDKFTVRLQSAQFVIGDNLQNCRNALVSKDHDNLHLLERTSIDLQVQNSIVPTAYRLARFKISGHLPSLQVNLSDTKYKALMRLVDVTIPHFDDDVSGPTRPVVDRSGGSFRLTSGLFGTLEPDLDVEAQEQKQATPIVDQDDEFYEADDGSASQKPEIHQHVVEIHFLVDALRASLLRSSSDGDRELGNVTLSGFALDFAMEKYVMEVDVNLESMSMQVLQTGKAPLDFMTSSGTSTEKDLLKVKYTRAQPESPEFATVHEGINQSVDVKITTFTFRVAPEPLVTLYDFIMTTFVPNKGPQQQIVTQPVAEAVTQPSPAASLGQGEEGKIRVFVKLASVEVILTNNDVRLATLSMATGDFSVLLRANTMRINARLGSLALSDDSDAHTSSKEFKQLLSIEGDNFADFQYQTYDPQEKETYKGVKSSVYLSAGSLKVHFLEQPLRAIYLFLLKLAKLKGLYDAATVAAVQRAGEIDSELMQFEIIVKSPIIVFPTDSRRSQDVLTLRLGELKAQNSYEGLDNKIAASLRGIQLSSRIHYEGKPSVLKLIDDIDVNAEVLQAGGVEHQEDPSPPGMQITVTISDVLLHLTQVQYHLLLALSNSVTRALAVPTDALSVDLSAPEKVHLSETEVSTNHSTVDLLPEVRPHPTDGQAIGTTIDLIVTLQTVKLHLYDEQATGEDNLGKCGIAHFALNSTTLRAKVLSDNAKEVEVVLKSFTMRNTRPGNSKFREIIPAANHNRNQVMVLYTMSGEDPGGLAVITVDAPQVILAIEPVIGLLSFFLNPAPSPSGLADQPIDATLKRQSEATAPSETPSAGGSLNVRFDLHDVFVSILEDDTNPESQAIRLSIQHVLISQQGVLALTVNHLGMSLSQMGKNADSVRFLDDVDLTLSLDSRASAAQQMMSIEISVQPIIFRASYRDINLITTIVNKALQLYNQTIQAKGEATVSTSNHGQKTVASARARSSVAVKTAAVGRANVMTTKEQLKGSINGFRLILIGDVDEQPMLHLKVKPFIVGAKDWSGELQATATLAVQISYWNLTNSHWEPLIDPWTFSASLNRESQSGGLNMTVSARERLNLNVSTTLIELAIATANLMGKEVVQSSRTARGSSAPYRICNRTGSPVLIWSDLDGSANTRDAGATQIATGKTVDWRFDDWRTMREHITSSGNHSIGVQFIGKQWEQLRSIPVDRVGVYTFTLRPRTEKYAHRLLCEVTVQDNVKVVTLRSTYLVENKTLYPLEVTLVDASGQPVHSLEKIAPGQDYALPLEAASQNRIRVQPDQGFGYKWSSAIRWEDLIAKRSFTIRCPHADPNEAAFRFQAWVDTDANDDNARKNPRITLKLRAPLELENLLPYNIEYRIYDKDTDQNWRSYLRKGGIMPVHSVELRHLVLLNVSVQDTGFKPSDFAIINTDGSADFDTESRLTLRDSKDRKLDLRLNYVRYPDSGGSFKVQIYSPYLVINKTGLPFEVRPFRASRIGSAQDIAGDTRPEVMSQPIPFMLSLPEQNKNLVFRIGDSSWSQLVSLDAPSAEMRLAIPSQTQKAEEVHAGLSWTEGLGKYKLTKVITLAPRFIVRNASEDVISFRELGSTPRGRATLNPGERAPLHYLRMGEEKLLTVAFPGLNAQWSAPINVEDIGTMHFRLKATIESNEVHLMRADVKLGGATIFIVISREKDGWPFTIENESDFSFVMYQTDVDHPDSSPSNAAVPRYVVSKRTNMDYAWDYPAAREKKLVLAVSNTRRIVDIMEIGDLVPFKFADPQGTRIVSLDLRAEAHKQVLRITRYDPEISLYKPRRRQSGSLARQDTITGSQEAFEAVQEEVVSELSFNLDLEGIGMSLINKRMVEVVYLSLNGLKIEYTNSAVAQAINLSIGSLQIDNQLHDAIFPVVLQPTPLPKNVSSVASLPTVQASLIWLKDQEHGVTFIKYFSVLLQALTVEADEDFLFALYDLTKLKGASWDVAQEDVLIQEVSEEIAEPQAVGGGQDVYFEVLELQPIRLSISFMRTERVSGEDKLSLRNPIAVVLNAITMAVGNINDAQLEMNSLAIKDMRLTLPELQHRVVYHYSQDVLRQLYRILGSADFIGNPVGLFTNVSSGVADIFYEPFNGAVMRGNKELGISIAKGAASFVKKTVFGVSDSVTKFTGSLGKGLSAATFDSEYQMRRRMNQRRNKPRHAIYGVAAGAEAFANSVASGVEGVLLKPIEGAESEGAKGFFKGIGKGIVGVVTKPVVGVFDLASNVAEGIRNTTTVFDNPERDRVRMPRHVPADMVLVPYSEREALGQYWMKDLENGAYRSELYVAHINLPGGDNVVLLTSTRVLSFWSNRLRLEWELPFTQMQGVTIEDTGIRFAHKAGKEHDKFVIIPDKSSQSWFFSQVASVVKAYNARRRMDT